MAKKNLSDLLGLGLLFVAIFILLTALETTGITKFLGVVGGTMLAISQIVFLWKKLM